MYVDTIFGIKWRDAVSTNEIIMFFVVIILIITAYSLYKYDLKIKSRLEQARLLFQFKIKHYGLTGLQIRIVNYIIKKLNLKNPQIIFTNPELFEDSIGDILDYMKTSMEDHESLINICKDLIITYEKLYHHMSVRKPVEKISDLEPGVLLFFYLDASAVYIGKLIEKTDSQMKLQLFREWKRMSRVETGKAYNFFLWRSGDAEYIFTSNVLLIEENFVSITMPSEFIRGKEVRRPYIEVFIPCTLILPDESVKAADEQKVIEGSILKLNENELVLRCSYKLNYNYVYALDFVIDEFNMNTFVSLIADKTITEGNIHYYTCKIVDVSEAAKLMLHKFINDRF
ncbi:MAG: hypothetical protein V1874_01960 [Spirochaetota bacterium]